MRLGCVERHELSVRITTYLVDCLRRLSFRETEYLGSPQPRSNGPGVETMNLSPAEWGHISVLRPGWKSKAEPRPGRMPATIHYQSVECRELEGAAPEMTRKRLLPTDLFRPGGRAFVSNRGVRHFGGRFADVSTLEPGLSNEKSFWEGAQSGSPLVLTPKKTHVASYSHCPDWWTRTLRSESTSQGGWVKYPI